MKHWFYGGPPGHLGHLAGWERQVWHMTEHLETSSMESRTWGHDNNFVHKKKISNRSDNCEKVADIRNTVNSTPSYKIWYELKH